MKKIRNFLEWVIITLMIAVGITAMPVFAIYSLYFLAGYIASLFVERA